MTAVVTVRAVDPEVTRALIHAVLRPYQPPAALDALLTGQIAFAAYPAGGADDAGADHAGAQVVGTALVAPDPMPERPEAPDPWRLRGMATDPGWRGRGVGSAVLEAGIDHVRSVGGSVLWCNARTSARGFYERAGFGAIGAEWEFEGSGRHVRMWRDL